MSEEFKMAPTPESASDSLIEKLFEGELKPAIALAAAFDRIEEIMHKPPEPTSVPELLFHTNKRRNLEFDRVPVGHSLGYRCYDGSKHDPESAHSSGEYGDGLTEDQAYVDWLHAMDDINPKPRIGRLIDGGGGTQPPEYADIPEHRDEE